MNEEFSCNIYARAADELFATKRNYSRDVRNKWTETQKSERNISCDIQCRTNEMYSIVYAAHTHTGNNKNV